MGPCLSGPYRVRGCSEEDESGGVNEMSCLTGHVNAALYLELFCSFKQTQTGDRNKEACWDRRGAVTPGQVLPNATAPNATITFLARPSHLPSYLFCQLLHGCVFIILLLLLHNLCFAQRFTLPTTQKRKSEKRSTFILLVWFLEYSGYFGLCGVHRQKKQTTVIGNIKI